MMNCRLSLCAGLLCALLGVSVPAAAAAATPDVAAQAAQMESTRDARLAWFRDAHFGMFVHFGLYSQYGGVWKGQIRKINRCAEWMMLAARAPRAEYAAAAKTFNPAAFDADAWIRTLRNAGMKYIVLTTKHHEGFALFDSDASAYNIADATPFKRDLVREIADACHRHGVRLGFYYSHNLDWYHPGGGGNSWEPTSADTPAGNDRYVETLVLPQLRELLTKYGKVDMLWFDIPGGVISPKRAAEILTLVRSLQPDIVINNRLRGGMPFDVQTPENHIPATGIPGADWESCMTMNHSWGFAPDDHDWKSVRSLLHTLVDVTSKGGNMLLNVGPDGNGRFPQAATDRLLAMGRWLKQYGEAVYGTRASVFPQLPSWGRFTVKPLPDGRTVLYAVVFDPPASGELLMPGLLTEPDSVRLLGENGRPLAVKNTDLGPAVVLDEAARNDRDFAVRITLKGAPKLSDCLPPADDGSFLLLPRSAALSGGMRPGTIAISGLGEGGEEHLTGWTSSDAAARWRLRIPADGTYRVTLRYAADASSAGSEIALEIGGLRLPFRIPAGTAKSGAAYSDAVLGTVRLRAGETSVSTVLLARKGPSVCRLASVKLTRLPEAKSAR